MLPNIGSRNISNKDISIFIPDIFERTMSTKQRIHKTSKGIIISDISNSPVPKTNNKLFINKIVMLYPNLMI